MVSMVPDWVQKENLQKRGATDNYLEILQENGVNSDFEISEFVSLRLRVGKK